MRIAGRILILAGLIITVVSALFCIIGLSTKGWRGSTGLFDNGMYKSTAALSVISFILLIITIIVLVLQMFDMLTGVLRLVSIILLFIATIFLLGTLASILEQSLGYSFDLMVVAHFCSYVALAIIAFWLGQSSVESSSTG
ncbi:unnamed protein product [Rotaria sordida]|uniref:Uncharacterized protein n=1 Tax=Rotaria sordida TaxID=392033 RepID=A0A815I866_9BILA|nr:unnamed protein product [Rotaria sordida]CAF1362497.1 unnamed protein product [Rotaria sordida]